VELTAAGRTQVKSIQAGKGYGASEELLAHFGLGSAESVERLSVIWPDGGRSELGAVRANQTLKVRQ
jgi:hypothetical protein